MLTFKLGQGPRSFVTKPSMFTSCFERRVVGACLVLWLKYYLFIFYIFLKNYIIFELLYYFNIFI
jgi:hypothetical protein